MVGTPVIDNNNDLTRYSFNKEKTSLTVMDNDFTGCRLKGTFNGTEIDINFPRAQKDQMSKINSDGLNLSGEMKLAFILGLNDTKDLGVLLNIMNKIGIKRIDKDNIENVRNLVQHFNVAFMNKTPAEKNQLSKLYSEIFQALDNSSMKDILNDMTTQKMIFDLLMFAANARHEIIEK